MVCSDAGAPSNLVDSEHYFDTHEEATAASLLSGVDSFTDHGTDGATIVARVQGALDQGLLTEADVDAAVRRQLSVRFRLGEFDPDHDPHSGTEDFDTPPHRALAQEAAEQTVVLLKNDDLLPLAHDTRLAVVGLLADECKLDWYSGTLIHRSTPLEGLYERFGAERVEFAEGVDRVLLRTLQGAFLHVPLADVEDEVRGAEGALDQALLAGRTDLPPAHHRRDRHRARSRRLGRGRPHPPRPRRPLPLGRRRRLCPRLRRPARRLGRPGDIPPGTTRERSPPAAHRYGSPRLCRRRRREGCRRGRGRLRGGGRRARRGRGGPGRGGGGRGARRRGQRPAHQRPRDRGPYDPPPPRPPGTPAARGPRRQPEHGPGPGLRVPVRGRPGRPPGDPVDRPRRPGGGHRPGPRPRRGRLPAGRLPRPGTRPTPTCPASSTTT